MDNEDWDRTDALNIAGDFLVEAMHGLQEGNIESANVAGNLCAVAMGLADRIGQPAQIIGYPGTENIQ